MNIMFSTQFPSNHPKGKQPTHFAEKLMKCFAETIPSYKIPETFIQFDWDTYYNCTSYKSHTIRSGYRFKEGSKFIPCIWEQPGGMWTKGNKIIPISQEEIEIKKIWDIVMYKNGVVKLVRENVTSFFERSTTKFAHLAKNDGLNEVDFFDWFKVHSKKGTDGIFKGQVLCWDENINY